MNVFTEEVRRSCVENVMNASNEIASVIDVIRGYDFPEPAFFDPRIMEFEGDVLHEATELLNTLHKFKRSVGSIYAEEQSEDQ